jgi:hypothetical protein
MHAGNHMGIMTTFKKPTAEREWTGGIPRLKQQCSLAKECVRGLYTPTKEKWCYENV